MGAEAPEDRINWSANRRAGQSQRAFYQSHIVYASKSHRLCLCVRVCVCVCVCVRERGGGREGERERNNISKNEHT